MARMNTNKKIHSLSSFVSICAIRGFFSSFSLRLGVSAVQILWVAGYAHAEECLRTGLVQNRHLKSNS
jgi:hypothetical protein